MGTRVWVKSVGSGWGRFRSGRGSEAGQGNSRALCKIKGVFWDQLGHWGYKISQRYGKREWVWDQFRQDGVGIGWRVFGFGRTVKF